MKIIITGGAGFLGVRLARTLLAKDSLSLNGQAAQRITRIPWPTARHHLQI